MTAVTNELTKRLETLAYKKSQPFCYHCYETAPTGRCKKCFSDDLMRIVPGVGCDWNCQWIIEHLISENLEPVNTTDAFEESIRGCYAETVQVLWMTLDAVSTAKEMDPVSWNMAQSEWESQELDEGNFTSFDNGSTYFWTHEVESYLDTEESS